MNPTSSHEAPALEQESSQELHDEDISIEEETEMDTTASVSDVPPAEIEDVEDPNLLDNDEEETNTGAEPERKPESVSTTTQRKARARPEFSDAKWMTAERNREIVTINYGFEELENPPHRPPRQYLITTDFGVEAAYAMKWGIGTVLRNGDIIHLVTVIAEDDEGKVDARVANGEVRQAADMLLEKTKAIFSEMYLLNIQIFIYAIAGKVKEALTDLIDELPLTMVICGSRGLTHINTILMGSISTYLVRNSSVPVSVVRNIEKKKRVEGRFTRARRLSEGVRTGTIKVDELG